MMVVHRSVLLLVALVIVSPLLCGQDLQHMPAISDGAHLVLGPLDQFSRAFGLQDDRMRDAARRGIESHGWQLNDGSDLMISVTIIALPQRDEDMFSFRIEVHGGTSLDKAAGRENAPDVIGDIPAVKTISVPWNNESKILSTTKQLAATVAVKLRKEIIRRQSNRR